MADSGSMRADDGEDLLAGYVSGPAAATEATAVALARAEAASAIAAWRGLATRSPSRLSPAGVAGISRPRASWSCPPAALPASPRYLRRFGRTGTRLAGLCDAGEAHIVQRALTPAGLGTASSRADLERQGFFTCVEDLEDELIRAAGPAQVMEVFAAHGDLRAFRTIQRQPAWRGKDEAAQLRRFLAAGAQRKLRYARLLTEAVSLDRVPRPLAAVLTAV